MGRKLIDMTGKIFGRLTVVADTDKEKGKRRRCECRCSCGKITTVSVSNLRGATKSCGCLLRESAARRGKISKTTHGLSFAPIYSVWNDMIQRCANSNHKNYHNYGGRGIKVCDRWLKFENFYEDMGDKPKGMSIDRKNNNEGYRPGNCRWATTKQQNRNTRQNRFLEFKGKRKLLIEWAEEVGINHSSLRKRLARGWSTEKALFTPIL